MGVCVFLYLCMCWPGRAIQVEFIFLLLSFVLRENYSRSIKLWGRALYMLAYRKDMTRSEAYSFFVCVYLLLLLFFLTSFWIGVDELRWHCRI